MRWRFILSVSLKQLWNNIKSTLVVFLSLTVCVTSVFLMAEALLYSNTFIQNMEVNRRTYSIENNGYHEDYLGTYDLYKEVFSGSTLPEISCIDNIYANPTNTISDSVDGTSEENFSLAIYRQNDIRYTVKFDLIAGREFTEEEITNGANVVILSDTLNYWRSGNEYRVGDTVQINGISYEIIGLDRTESYITEQNVLEHRNFCIYFDNIEFTKKLTSAEEQILVDLFATVDATPSSWFSQQFSEFMMHLITYVALIGLVSYCAFSIIAQLFNYMVKSRMYEYNIYKVLGVGKALLFALYFTPIALVAVLSNVAGFLLYRYSEPLQQHIGMGDTLSSGICVLCFAVVGVVLLIAVLPNYRKLKWQSAIETR